MKINFEITDIDKNDYNQLLQDTWDELKGSYHREDFINDNLKEIHDILEVLGHELKIK